MALKTRLVLVRPGVAAPDYTRPPAAWELDPSHLESLDHLATHPELGAAELFFAGPELRARQTAARLADAGGRADAGASGQGVPGAGAGAEHVTVLADLAGLQQPAGHVPDYVRAVANAILQADVPAQPGWEPAAHCRQRVLAAMATIAISHAQRHIAVVAPGIALCLFMAWLRGQREPDPADWQALSSPDLAVVTWEDRQVHLDFGQWRT